MKRHIHLLLLISFVLAACSTAAPSTQAPTQAPQPTQQVVQPTQPVVQPTATSPSAANAALAYKGPGWTKIPLVNVRTGESFTLASFAGKTVFVEPMATWCTNCRRQLPNVEAARLQLKSDQYVFVGFSVAENVDNATLAKYVESNGWNFIFAVAPETLTKGMVDTFGRTVVTPPSTPHFIIRPDGTIMEMKTGSHSADALVAELKTASGG